MMKSIQRQIMENIGIIRNMIIKKCFSEIDENNVRREKILIYSRSTLLQHMYVLLNPIIHFHFLIFQQKKSNNHVTLTRFCLTHNNNNKN